MFTSSNVVKEIFIATVTPRAAAGVNEENRRRLVLVFFRVQHAGAAGTSGLALRTWRPRVGGRGWARGGRWAPTASTWGGGRTTGAPTSTACTQTRRTTTVVGGGMTTTTACDHDMSCRCLAGGTRGTATPLDSTSSARLSLHRDDIAVIETRGRRGAFALGGTSQGDLTFEQYPNAGNSHIARVGARRFLTLAETEQ